MNNSYIIGGIVAIALVGWVGYAVVGQDKTVPEEGEDATDVEMTDLQIKMEGDAFIEKAKDHSASDKWEYYMGGTGKLEVSFIHTVPGKYSDIYARVSGLEPGTRMIGHLSPGDEAEAGTAGDDGVVLLTWRITSYGEYEVIINDLKGIVFEKKTIVVK